MSGNPTFGYIDPDHRTYVITDPNTPEPWINYLMGQNLNLFISNGAGGPAWYGQPNTGRLTRYRFNGLPMDTPGFYLYVNDRDVIWNPSHFPTRTPLDRYECRHSLGTTRFISEKDGIQVSVTYIIPLKDDILLWDIRIENRTETPRRLALYPYLDFSLQDVLKNELHFMAALHQARYTRDPESGGLTHEYFAFESTFTGRTLFGANESFTSFDMRRNVFIGRGRTEADPLGLEQGLQNSEVKDGGFHACGVFELPVTLAPGASRRMVVKLAVGETIEQARILYAKYDSPDTVDQAQADIETYWDEVLSKCRVETPDENTDLMLNAWLPKTIKATLRNGRAISPVHTGSGTSYRFRDGMQDIMSAFLLFPEEARTRIRLLLRSMASEGWTLYNFAPDFQWYHERPLRIDAIVWGVFTLHKYLAETGDIALFDEVLPYFDKGEGTVLDHLVRGMKFVGDHTGSHGLPLLFDTDWNDMLVVFSDARDGGETVMVAEQYVRAARQMIELLRHLKQEQEIPYFEEKIEAFTKALSSEACWDGAWFKRLLYPDAAIGSASNPEGQIFLNTQTWAVLAGTLPEDKVRRAMDSVAERLDTEVGLRLSAAPFTKRMDGSRWMANTPGAGENGGIFVHANTWAILAETMLGRPERAWKYFSQILPGVLSARDPVRYAREPYAIASWIFGPDHEAFGHAAFTWLTGSASWLHLIGTEHILGVRPTLSGLLVAPCVPPDWKGYRVRRKLRGAEYRITVENPHGKGCGRVSVQVDGKPIESNCVPYAAPGKTVEVHAVVE